MKKLLLIVVVLALGVCASTSQADVQILQCTGFVAVKASSAGPVSGAAVIFDLSQIPPGARIDIAELHIFYTADTALGKTFSIIASPAAATWAPSSLPTSTVIPSSDTLVDESLGASGLGQEAVVNVTETVAQWVKEMRANNGFVIVGSSDGTKAFVVSQSGGNVSVTLTIYYTL